MIIRLLHTFTLFMSFLVSLPGITQDIMYTREIINDLCSSKMHGRGYYKNGDLKAAKYIAREFSKLGVEKLSDSYFQDYTVNINVISGNVSVRIDNRELIPGTEFLVSSSSPPLHGTWPLVWDADSIRRTDLPQGSFFPVTASGIKEIEKDFPYDAPGAVILRDTGENMWWHVSNGRQVSDHSIVIVRSDVISKESRLITLNVESEFVPDYKTQNVAGFIRGSSNPDSFIVFTAHYDHIGQMGKEVFFPGANDNASGTAMIIDLARHFSQKVNEPQYSIAFIAFSGEEAGLEGSLHFVNNPLIPLGKIKMLINLDMVGTGDEGITVVNGSVLEKELSLLKTINDREGYLKEVKERGESCNSDHCPFYMKGVPAVFIYTRSSIFNEYHNLQDSPDDLPLSGYDGLFRLLVDFTKVI